MSKILIKWNSKDRWSHGFLIGGKVRVVFFLVGFCGILLKNIADNLQLAFILLLYTQMEAHTTLITFSKFNAIMYSLSEHDLIHNINGVCIYVNNIDICDADQYSLLKYHNFISFLFSFLIQRISLLCYFLKLESNL